MGFYGPKGKCRDSWFAFEKTAVYEDSECATMCTETRVTPGQPKCMAFQLEHIQNYYNMNSYCYLFDTRSNDTAKECPFDVRAYEYGCGHSNSDFHFVGDTWHKDSCECTCDENFRHRCACTPDSESLHLASTTTHIDSSVYAYDFESGEFGHPGCNASRGESIVAHWSNMNEMDNLLIQCPPGHCGVNTWQRQASRPDHITLCFGLLYFACYDYTNGTFADVLDCSRGSTVQCGYVELSCAGPPTFSPTIILSPPSQSPSYISSINPSLDPSKFPSREPTRSPSIPPSHIPSTSPFFSPTRIPSFAPTTPPSIAPSADPTSYSTAPTIPATNPDQTNLPSHSTSKMHTTFPTLNTTSSDFIDQNETSKAASSNVTNVPMPQIETDAPTSSFPTRAPTLTIPTIVPSIIDMTDAPISANRTISPTPKPSVIQFSTMPSHVQHSAGPTMLTGPEKTYPPSHNISIVPTASPILDTVVPENPANYSSDRNDVPKVHSTYLPIINSTSNAVHNFTSSSLTNISTSIILTGAPSRSLPTIAPMSSIPTSAPTSTHPTVASTNPTLSPSPTPSNNTVIIPDSRSTDDDSIALPFGLHYHDFYDFRAALGLTTLIFLLVLGLLELCTRRCCSRKRHIEKDDMRQPLTLDERHNSWIFSNNNEQKPEYRLRCSFYGDSEDGEDNSQFLSPSIADSDITHASYPSEPGPPFFIKVRAPSPNMSRFSVPTNVGPPPIAGPKPVQFYHSNNESSVTKDASQSIGDWDGLEMKVQNDDSASDTTTDGWTNKLQIIAELYSTGLLTAEEFQLAKEKLLRK